MVPEFMSDLGMTHFTENFNIIWVSITIVAIYVVDVEGRR